jgi:hypothetical protein
LYWRCVLKKNDWEFTLSLSLSLSLFLPIPTSHWTPWSEQPLHYWLVPANDALWHIKPLSPKQQGQVIKISETVSQNKVFLLLSFLRHFVTKTQNWLTLNYKKW